MSGFKLVVPVSPNLSSVQGTKRCKSLHKTAFVVIHPCLHRDSLTALAKSYRSPGSSLHGLIFAYTIWLFISDTYIASAIVIVKRTNVSLLRGGRQKGSRIQHTCEFSEPSSPSGDGGTVGFSVSESKAVAGIRSCPWWPVASD